ncbi:MAG: DUF2971 domain-containing protein [Hyphomicrobiaceae bacterium]
MENKFTDLGSRTQILTTPTQMGLAAYVYKNYNIPKQFVKPETVYHYTDAAGFLGIVTSGRFWATNADFLNDPSEATFALDAVDVFLTEYCKTRPDDANFVTECKKLLKVRRDEARYVVSFCQDGDLLSQWRGYGKFGAGYALGFFADQLKSSPKGGMCYEVDYGTQQLELALRDVLGLLREYASSQGGYRGSHFEFSESVRYLTLSIKHPKFREEREVRLIFQRALDPAMRDGRDEHRGATVRYRPRGADIVEYLDTPVAFAVPQSKESIPKLPLCKVIVGPGVQFSNNINSIKALLCRHGFEKVDVAESKVPFRT